MDAQLPMPGCRREGVGLTTGQDFLPSLKQVGRGRRECGGTGGNWEEEGSVNIWKNFKKRS